QRGECSPVQSRWAPVDADTDLRTPGIDAPAHQQQTCGNRRACPGRRDLDAETAHSKGLLGGRRIFVAGQVAGLYLECVRAGSQAAEWDLGAGVEGRVGTAVEPPGVLKPGHWGEIVRAGHSEGGGRVRDVTAGPCR